MDPFTVVDLIGAALSGVIEYPITDQRLLLAASELGFRTISPGLVEEGQPIVAT